MQMLYAPLSPDLRVDPYPVYAAIRSAEPMQYNGASKSWTLTRHADCLSILRNPIFSSKLAQGRRQRLEALPTSMLNTDPPEHTRLRAPLNKVFARIDNTPALRDIAAFARARISECARSKPPADLMAGFAQPVVTHALMAILGLPPADANGLGELVAGASINLDPLVPPDLQSRAEQASSNLREYLRTVLRERRRKARDDLMTALVTAADKAGLSEIETLTTCNLLIIGGHDPAVHAIGNAIVALLRHPAQRQRLLQDSSLLPTAVEEFLRFDSPIQLAARVANQDVSVAEATIRRGEAVIVLIGAANRDPQAFANPECLDIGRQPNPHIAFGGGAHFCLGARLVRALMPAALGALLGDLPRMALTSDDLQWNERVIPRGVKELPVTFQ
jgi:cytochrome P450